VLTEIADGVYVRQSEFCMSNAVVVRGSNGVLLVDPGVNGDDLSELADDMDTMELAPTIGFATHPHWDHVLWHRRFGDVVRYGTKDCVQTARAPLENLRDAAGEYAPGTTTEQIGKLTELPKGCLLVPLDGRTVRVLEHRAHARGHAALLLEEPRVLVAGDMLSDVEIPCSTPMGSSSARSTWEPWTSWRPRAAIAWRRSSPVTAGWHAARRSGHGSPQTVRTCVA
jgi:glyoxylase-like metal-dependent hydrolase (beta-lactamase superfamily II)